MYVELKGRTCDAILELIARERDGEIVDRALIKNVLDIYIEVGMGNMDLYERDFEAHLLNQTRLYCAQQAASWFAEDSCPEYMTKAEASLAAEEERVDKYLHASTKPKLLGVVEEELLAKYERQLIEKEASGCAALLYDDKVWSYTYPTCTRACTLLYVSIMHTITHPSINCACSSQPLHQIAPSTPPTSIPTPPTALHTHRSSHSVTTLRACFASSQGSPPAPIRAWTLCLPSSRSMWKMRG